MSQRGIARVTGTSRSTIMRYFKKRSFSPSLQPYCHPEHVLPLNSMNAGRTLAPKRGTSGFGWRSNGKHAKEWAWHWATVPTQPVKNDGTRYPRITVNEQLSLVTVGKGIGSSCPRNGIVSLIKGRVKPITLRALTIRCANDGVIWYANAYLVARIPTFMLFGFDYVLITTMQLYQFE